MPFVDDELTNSAASRALTDADADRLSAEQRAWKRFRDTGVNVKAWAVSRGFNPALVYSVLRGERKCLRGQSHEVAVALGLKTPNH